MGIDLEKLNTIGMVNVPFAEKMYTLWEENPGSVDSSWHHLFGGTAPLSRVEEGAGRELRVYRLIDAYRTYGHLFAKINPIATQELQEPWQLKIETLGFEQSELDASFPTCGLMREERAPLREIVEALRETYCGKIGVEYMGLQRPEMELWLQQQIEPNRFKFALSIEEKKSILQHLNKSELLEVFLHTKYVGQKRFSLEGGETLIPIMAATIEKGAELGFDEFVLGMAHRGRLNVLTNILNKSYADIFTEFEEGYIPLSFEGSGDVKYHKGFSAIVETVSKKKVKIDLCPNPSHLEAVDPVVEGLAYARQIQRGNPAVVIPILVHGDAAIAGQGVVYETMQLYKLPGYSTGGTIHIVINNQIGFTTLPENARSTYYCTDIARAFSAPVFHVNGDDPEGCAYAAILAVELRQKFQCDVFIDLNCYRKYGHNEADEPAFTQPLEYQVIRQKTSTREMYRDDLIQQGVLERQMAEALEAEFKASLQQALEGKEFNKKGKPEEKNEKAAVRKGENLFEPVKTGVALARLREIGDKLGSLPEGFSVHSKLSGLIEERRKMAHGELPVSWGMAEMLAYGSLLWEGTHVRLTGQDTCRGTFSHRHAVLMDQKQEHAYAPLDHLTENQGRFDVINSPLTEYAGMGFEYGYSLVNPASLVIWEAQFGDFCNGAQIVIDQFLSTGEQKWGQLVNLVLLLPHGYEGQGPEHSSARMERFLTLCGNNNMLVVQPSTPAQLFHVLRRQVLSGTAKPLIVFTPKGLLRLPACVNDIADFCAGSFEEILDDPTAPRAANEVVLCSGRLYYDLIAEREKHKAKDMAIIRIEQLYPLHTEKLNKILAHYPSCITLTWAQDEHSNMGAWDYIRPNLRLLLPKKANLKYVGRGRSASPAAGSLALHKREHAQMIDELFGKQAKAKKE